MSAALLSHGNTSLVSHQVKILHHSLSLSTSPFQISAACITNSSSSSTSKSLCMPSDLKECPVRTLSQKCLHTHRCLAPFAISPSPLRVHQVSLSTPSPQLHPWAEEREREMEGLGPGPLSAAPAIRTWDHRRERISADRCNLSWTHCAIGCIYGQKVS